MILDGEAASLAFGVRLADVVAPGDVITLSGPLGAGKTSISRGLIAALGHEGEVPSPTFSIVQPYENLDPPVWHVDLYRLEEEGELDELGLEAAEEGVLLVEWPSRAGRWAHALQLTLEIDERTGARRLTAEVPQAWKERWPL
ncbi:tRNA (adenosine(37)-N6)-threonylcarbamoyltransferase complex ATPase subunit type 1 TsaE [Sphingomicrobium clamense]|uniref:tRNA (Adenosine(37)-N6)-threonylcarbamoyltransferase complex ATPase subunit type 1 TsaE n=1 Tax=Sphingomicrobium clamense TaxID=2851013 RepID=A0ABS6V669_9SPHN|nr:tRNA (adenosine(37)-N6)-threonylcarbamoyltransferase complex ATPase subunit type 1 TsaE [Sphingomicrobium sp. B8]MBW0145060.1 tRNA (adenosine(37)-N6)-threonylcarbamoyltransferase complex ATPase subunit type 1 TsaE [Sphingomicrobium sp. B8]